MLDRVSAAELDTWLRLYQLSPWGPEADDWRTGYIMAAMNGESPDSNRPKWVGGSASSEPRVIMLSFAEACQALAR